MIHMEMTKMIRENTADIASKLRWFRAGMLFVPSAMLLFGIYILELTPHFNGWKSQWTATLRWTLGIQFLLIFTAAIYIAKYTYLRCFNKRMLNKIGICFGVALAWSLVQVVIFGVCQLLIENILKTQEKTNNLSLEAILGGFIVFLIFIIFPVFTGGAISLGIKKIIDVVFKPK